jgi:Glycine-zipper domain
MGAHAVSLSPRHPHQIPGDAEPAIHWTKVQYRAISQAGSLAVRRPRRARAANGSERGSTRYGRKENAMLRHRTRWALLVAGALALAGPGQAGAQAGMYVYPARGQSPQQQESDRGQCYGWAVQQTGFDPANPQVGGGPPPMMGQPRRGMFRGAAGGAAMGAIGGAIGGDAGRGAAIGGGVGALFGLMRRHRAEREEEMMMQSYDQRQQGLMAQGRGNYDRAFSACMTARGYTVS